MEELQKIEVSDLKSSKYETFSPTSNDEDYRLTAVRRAGVMVGAQHGFNQRIEKRKAQYRAMSDTLDSLYDFRTLMTLASSNQNGKFLIPAILGEQNGVKALSDDASVITISERRYEIIRPARLALRAPNWRGYLLYDKKMETTLPSELLMPKDKSERVIWKDAIAEGWTAGEKMAERELMTRIRRMHQDFQGIIKNVKLSEQGKLQQTLVTYDYNAVTGGGDQMLENQHTYRIAAPASLNGNMSNWKPIIMSSRDSLSFPLEKGTYVDPLGDVDDE